MPDDGVDEDMDGFGRSGLEELSSDLICAAAAITMCIWTASESRCTQGVGPKMEIWAFTCTMPIVRIFPSGTEDVIEVML